MNNVNLHNKFNNNNYLLRRWKYAIANNIYLKAMPGETLLPLLPDGTIAHVYNENINIDERLILLWFFKYGFDVGYLFNGKVFHIEPKHKENEACSYATTGFRLYEVKNGN